MKRNQKDSEKTSIKLLKKNEIFIPVFASLLFLTGIITAISNVLLFNSFLQIFIILIGLIYMFLAVSLAQYKRWAYKVTIALFAVITVFNIFYLFDLISLYFQIDGLAPTSGILYLIFIALINIVLNVITVLVLIERKSLFKR